MDDEEYAAQKQRLRTLVERWIKPIGLGWWHIEMSYVRTDFEANGKPEPNTIATTSANWRYGHASITWNMPQVKEQDDDDLERAFVHELMHVFLDETRMGDPSHEDWLDHEERVASTLAKAFLWLRDELIEQREGKEYPVDLNGIVLDGTVQRPELVIEEINGSVPQPVSVRPL